MKQLTPEALAKQLATVTNPKYAQGKYDIGISKKDGTVLVVEFWSDTGFVVRDNVTGEPLFAMYIYEPTNIIVDQDMGIVALSGHERNVVYSIELNGFTDIPTR